ncbi:MAG: glutamate--tRNA ligase, partial [Nitrososphaerales archaeon]|nr:glutamate--tRNA ligase [Nitrososphaerales archaeon]
MVKGVAGGIPQDAIDFAEMSALANAVKHGAKAEVGAVMSKVLGEFPDLRPRAAELGKEVSAVVKRVNSMSGAEQANLLGRKYPEAARPKEKEGRAGLPPLPNAVKGKAAFRLPPEPSGFMTIGHAMAFTINSLYREMYDGELWLRFEDTNPKKAANKYYESFRRGLAWLGIKPDHEKNVSEDNELLYGYGAKLLERGEAYACACDEAKVKKLRFAGTACEHRGHDPSVNLMVWQEMLSRKHREGSYVIRLKGNMSNVDYSLRDPNIFRIIEHDHPVTGTKYVVWPTYNFANAVEDEICGITHILRSSEFHVDLQQLIREKLSFRKVEVIQFSRFNFKGTPVHKRLLRPLVEEGLVSGWDDPRMPTVDGVRRRGILPEAIRQFTLQVGYTKSEHEYDWSLLFAVNRRLLDPISRRVFFVPNPVRLPVEAAPRRKAVIRSHPEADMGSRVIETSGEFFVPADDLSNMPKGSVFRLMDLYNVELVKAGERPEARYVGDQVIQDTRKLQWTTPDHAETRVLVPDVL